VSLSSSILVLNDAADATNAIRIGAGDSRVDVRVIAANEEAIVASRAEAFLILVTP
jgi:hypothetical protein